MKQIILHNCATHVLHCTRVLKKRYSFNFKRKGILYVFWMFFPSLNGITTQNTNKVSSALTNGYGCPLWKLLCVGNKLRKWGPVKFYTLCHRNAPMNFVLLVVCWLIRRKIFFKFFIFCPNSVEWNSCCCFIFMFTTGKLNFFSAEFFSSFSSHFNFTRQLHC